MNSETHLCNDSAHGSVGSSYSSTAKDSEMTLLPEDFKPGEHDVICGRGPTVFKHSGNVLFRRMVDACLAEYSNENATKIEKTYIVKAIISQVRSNSPHGGFVKKDTKDGRWYEVGDVFAREKTTQAFRDALFEQYKSSNEAKKIRKMCRRGLLSKSLSSSNLVAKRKNPYRSDSKSSTHVLSRSEDSLHSMNSADSRGALSMRHGLSCPNLSSRRHGLGSPSSSTSTFLGASSCHNATWYTNPKTASNTGNASWGDMKSSFEGTGANPNRLLHHGIQNFMWNNNKTLSYPEPCGSSGDGMQPNVRLFDALRRKSRVQDLPMRTNLAVVATSLASIHKEAIAGIQEALSPPDATATTTFRPIETADGGRCETPLRQQEKQQHQEGFFDPNLIHMPMLLSPTKANDCGNNDERMEPPSSMTRHQFSRTFSFGCDEDEDDQPPSSPISDCSADEFSDDVFDRMVDSIWDVAET